MKSEKIELKHVAFQMDVGCVQLTAKKQYVCDLVTQHSTICTHGQNLFSGIWILAV